MTLPGVSMKQKSAGALHSMQSAGGDCLVIGLPRFPDDPPGRWPAAQPVLALCGLPHLRCLCRGVSHSRPSRVPQPHRRSHPRNRWATVGVSRARLQASPNRPTAAVTVG